MSNVSQRVRLLQEWVEKYDIWGHTGPHVFMPFGLLIHDQCFLNLFTVSVLPRCLPLHHPLQLPVTREDTLTQVHPQIHNPCHPHNPDTTICPITGSVCHCLALLIPTACRGKKRIASHIGSVGIIAGL